MLGRKKKVQDCDYVFGSSTKFQRRMNGFVKADICRQVSVCLHVFCGILFALKPFCHYSLCSVCILPQPAFYSQSVVCILHSVWILPPGLQSAVRSPQSAFYTDRNENIIYIVLKLAIHLPIENGGIKFKELFIFLHSFKVVFNRRETTVEPLVRLLTATSPQRPPVCNSHFFGKQSIR